MKGKRLLLVDDDPKNIKILRESFSLAEFDVDFAPSDLEAFNKIELNPPDVIVTELAPPKIDGYRLLEQVERNPKTADVPVIFLTKKSDVWNRVKSFKLGAKDYIVKPLHVKEIVARINMVLNRVEKRKMQEAEERRKHTGRLEDLSVIDLIESLGVKRKSGVLTLTNENGKSGQIFFSEGSIINASCGNMVSEDAVYQMVPWRKGRFTIVFKQVDVPDEISVSNLGLLMQAAKRMEQREKILALLPDSNCVFVLSETFKKIISKKGVNPDLEKFVNLFDGVNDISRIIDASDYDDLRTLERINKLYKLGFLEIRDNGAKFEPSKSKPIQPPQDQEIEASGHKLPINKITFEPSPMPAIPIQEEPFAMADELPKPSDNDNGDLTDTQESFQPFLPAESSPEPELVAESFETELKATDDPGEPVLPSDTEPDAFDNLDILNEKVTEASLFNDDLIYNDSWAPSATMESPEPADADASDQVFDEAPEISADDEKNPTMTPEQSTPDPLTRDDFSITTQSEHTIGPEPSAQDIFAGDQPTVIQQRLEFLEKNYPFTVFENTLDEKEPEPEIETRIPDVALPPEPELRNEPVVKSKIDLPMKQDESGKKFGLGSRSDHEASLNQLIREVIPEKKTPVQTPEPGADRLQRTPKEPSQPPLPSPLQAEPMQKSKERPAPQMPQPPAAPRPSEVQSHPQSSPSSAGRADQGTLRAPSASKAQKEQPNIMIVTNDSQIRTEVINALTGGEYLAHHIGGTGLTDVYMGSVQFKGGRSLNILGITIEKEFKPVVDYLSSRIFGYIFLINSSRVSNWNYLGYLANSLNNKLNLPALILVYWDAAQGNWNEATIRARLGLIDGQKIRSISEINSQTTRRAIFSLFGVTHSEASQES